ncbi:MAG: NAD-dependent epimerase/dehydratase family protein [Dissulfurispiraceae bacterium]
MHVIAVTGASGFIGRHLINRLLTGGDIIVKALINRNPLDQADEKSNLQVVVGDLLYPETLSGLFDNGCTAVNLANLPSLSVDENLIAMANLADACAEAGIKRLIHCSTATVVGRATGDIISEKTDCMPYNEYESTKLEVEKLLIAKARGRFELIILRPTAVFGLGGKNLVKLAGDLLHGNKIVNYLRSCLYGHRRMNLVYIDNVTAAIDCLIWVGDNPDGVTYIISDDDSPSNNFRDVERFLIDVFGVKNYWLPPFSLPSFVLSAVLHIFRKSNTNPARNYDSSRLFAVGCHQRVSFEEGLRRFAEWYLKERHLYQSEIL